MSSPTSGRPLRVVVADDQTVVREGLVTMLDLLADITIVGAAADGEEALALIAAQEPDAALVDLHMPVLDGIEVTRRVTADHPAVAVIVLTTYVEDHFILTALRAGARSYLTKEATREDIARALQAAVAGQSVFDSVIQERLLRALPADVPSASEEQAGEVRLPEILPNGLTTREAEVLVLITRGLTNAQIADALFVSGHTVKTHINRLFAKTGSRSREDAIRFAGEHLGTGPAP